MAAIRGHCAGCRPNTYRAVRGARKHNSGRRMLCFHLCGTCRHKGERQYSLGVSVQRVQTARTEGFCPCHYSSAKRLPNKNGT